MKPEYFECFLDYHTKKASGFYRSENLTVNQQYFDYQNYLPDDILVKMDRASMANSIEVRSPFLDYRIHELAARLPRKWLIDSRGGKKILRDLASRYLPPEVVGAKKMGFGIPIQEWTRQERFLKETQDHFCSLDKDYGFFELETFKDLTVMHRKGRIKIGALLWNLNSLGFWREHWEK